MLWLLRRCAKDDFSRRVKASVPSQWAVRYSVETAVPVCCSWPCCGHRFFWSSPRSTKTPSTSAYGALIALDHLQYLDCWETSRTSCFFGFNDVATLKHQVYTNEHTVPQMMN
ncbi:uncharacterized protein LACBIDRAFT_312249 [Laccaria bicolor S238N-H82]|uniref:Predicted protein n=1 Tax=Laccaria bicolor (strain S238N-H82 / ATCC MYA-4686) TaxID=486041 RepID=B0DVT2_LACBS|nr:uncharacterized protein LACBIDRAFT_312249 [Laccaria bicolor S238N-H82]EDR01354.1 predicted protein [Laccaria bicolor S238N-H82]|eukprot:XP_001888061.1 predicted protein [Laccaria bicolor S238N-H82]